MTQKIVWESKSDRIIVAFVKKVKVNIYGARFVGEEATRAIKERDGWRIDKAPLCAGTWLPWEPISNEPFPTLDAAKDAIVAYANAEPQP